MTTVVKLKKIKEESEPVNLRHKTVVRIVLAPVRYTNESMQSILMQGTMYIRENLDSRMQEACARTSLGKRMAHGLLAQFGDELLEDEEDEVSRELMRRDLMGDTSMPAYDDGDDDDCEGDEDSDISDDSFGDMDDLGIDGKPDEEDKLKRKTSKVIAKYFRMIVPILELPFIAPSIRYTYKFAAGAAFVFPPAFVDMYLTKIHRKRKEYKWTAFAKAVSQFAPFIMHDLQAKQHASGRVGSCRMPVKAEADIVRISSRAFRDTALRIFRNAFRPDKYYKLYPHLPADIRDTIPDKLVEVIWKDIAEDGDIEPYLYPISQTPIDAYKVYEDLSTFSGLKLCVQRALHPKRKKKKKKKHRSANTNTNDDSAPNREDISDDDDDDDNDENEVNRPTNPMGEYILEANRVWRHFMDKSLTNTYAWTTDDIDGDPELVKDALFNLESDMVTVRVESNIFTSYRCAEMVHEIADFYRIYKDSILVVIGRGFDAGDLVVDSYVRANQPYPIDRKKRYIMCPTRSHTELASRRCEHTPVNLSDIDKVREDVRLKALPPAELIIVDGAHQFGLVTMHFLLSKIHESLCTRPRPFKLVLAGAPVLVACTSHANKWPIFKDMSLQPELTCVPTLIAPTGQDMMQTLGKNPGFKFTSDDAQLKVFTYDDSKSPEWSSLSKRESWKWFATQTHETAVRASEVITKMRDDIRRAGDEPLILFDYATTLNNVSAVANLQSRTLKNKGVVIEKDGGQATVTKFYEIKCDRSLSPFTEQAIESVEPKFVAYHIEGMPPEYRASLLTQPLFPLQPVTLMQCRYTPTKYVIFVSGTHVLRKDDILAASYYATKRLFILVPKSTKTDMTVSHYTPKRNMFAFFDSFNPC